MSSKNIVVTIELGHTASVISSVIPEKGPTRFTHEWEVFVRGMDGAPMDSFVEKVVFYLHNSFPKPRRIVRKPPFSVRECGYGGFILPIEVYFRSGSDDETPQKACFQYDLFLQRLDSASISNTRKEKLTFLNPSEEFRRKLFQGGGNEVSTSDDSKMNEKSVSRHSSGAKTKPVVRHQTNTTPTNQNSSSDNKKKSKSEPLKKAPDPIKPKPKTDSFQALFGEIIKKGSDHKVIKEKSSRDRDKTNNSNKEKDKSVSNKSSSSKKEKERPKESVKEKDSKKEYKKSEKEKSRDKEKREKHDENKSKEIKKSVAVSVSKDRTSEKDKNKKKEHSSSKRPRSPTLEDIYKKKREEETSKRKREEESNDKREKKEEYKEKKPKSEKAISEKVSIPVLKLSEKSPNTKITPVPSHSKVKPRKETPSPPNKDQKVSHNEKISKRGRPPKETKPRSPIPVIQPKAKQIPPPRSRSSSRSQSPSLSLSTSSSRSSSASSSSSESIRQSHSRSPSRSSSSRSSSSSSVKSKSRSSSRSRSKSPRSRPSTSSGSSSPSQRMIRTPTKDVGDKPLKILLEQALQGNSESSSSDDHDKPAPPPKKVSKGKVTPATKASSVQPKAKGPVYHVQMSPHSSSESDSDSDSVIHKPPPKVRRSASPYVNSSPRISNGAANVREPKVEQSVPAVVVNVDTAPPSRIDFQDLNALLDLRQKILLSFSNRGKVQEIVQIIGNNDSYELCQGHFTFDLCALDQQTIKKLQDCLS